MTIPANIQAMFDAILRRKAPPPEQPIACTTVQADRLDLDVVEKAIEAIDAAIAAHPTGDA